MNNNRKILYLLDGLVDGWMDGHFGTRLGLTDIQDDGISLKFYLSICHIATNSSIKN